MSEKRPPAGELWLGQRAYLRYLGGLAIINKPHAAYAEGVLAVVADEDPHAALVHAERMIYRGLRSVIFWANPPERRTDLQKYAEHNYLDVLPRMRQIVESTFRDQAAALAEIDNPAFAGLVPAPIIDDEPTYHNICHGNLGRLRTLTLIDGLQPAPLFVPYLADRSLAGRVVGRRSGAHSA